MSPCLRASPTKTHHFQASLRLAEQCPKAGGLTAAALSNAFAKGTGHVAPVMEAPFRPLSLTC